MKIKAFSTDGFGVCRSREVFTTKEMSTGSLRLQVFDEVTHGDFQGFGFAITGSSCYLLNKMQPENARRFSTRCIAKRDLDFRLRVFRLARATIRRSCIPTRMKTASLVLKRTRRTCFLSCRKWRSLTPIFDFLHPRGRLPAV